MSNLSHRIGIAISVSTLVIGLSYPVLAKPQLRSKFILTSQLTTKAATATGSRQPTEAILAKIKLKSSSSVKVSKATTRSTALVKSVARTTKTIQRTDADRSSQGTETFTKANRSNPRSNQSSGIDRWVD